MAMHSECRATRRRREGPRWVLLEKRTCPVYSAKRAASRYPPVWLSLTRRLGSRLGRSLGKEVGSVKES